MPAPRFSADQWGQFKRGGDANSGKSSRGPSQEQDLETQQARVDNQILFDEVLKGKFDVVVGNQWDVSLPGSDIVAITVSPVRQGKEVPVINVTPIRIVENEKGEERRMASGTFQITPNGGFVGKLPRALEGVVTKEQILHEALGIFETIGLGVFPSFETDAAILPDTIEKGEGGESWKGIDHARDPKRVEFIRRQKGALFMFEGSGKRGLSGVPVFVFDSFIFVGSERKEFAAFIFDLDDGITPEMIADMPKQNDPKAFTEWLQQQPWFPLLKQQRKEARAALKTGTIHGTVMTHQGNWEENIQQAIDERRQRS
ncbi:MAG: hypothetical protein ABIG71_01975 [Candidatus Uhrbacteria bacterium]